MKVCIKLCEDGETVFLILAILMYVRCYVIVLSILISVD